MAHPARPERLDELLEVLSNRHRRRICGYLIKEEMVDREDIVGYLRSTASRTRNGARGPTDKELAIAVRHRHVPRLRAAGIVEDGRDRDLQYCHSPLLEELLLVLSRYDPELDRDEIETRDHQ